MLQHQSSSNGKGRGRGKAPSKGDDQLGGLTELETKKMLKETLGHTQSGKKKLKGLGRKGIPNGMTEAEAIAAQEKLFN